MQDSMTDKIIDLFKEINKIPRCSRNEAAISGWLLSWAGKNGFNSRSDSAGNIVIEVPPSRGFENAPTVVLQGHMDMVCEKSKDSDHDFSLDPIKTIREGEWLTADGTTLGADNGIALAMALAVASEETLCRPPLELLFTVDEETGLNGANSLSNDFITGKILINIDSEDEGVFTIGCAGGRNCDVTLPLTLIPAPENRIEYRVAVSGARGGHSGVDIHKKRVNANKMLCGLLKEVHAGSPFGLASLGGGSAVNVIPREAAAVVVLDAGFESEFKEAVSLTAAAILAEHRSTEPALSISCDKVNANHAPMVAEGDTGRLLTLLDEIPHGVLSMSEDYEDLVETSINFAVLSLSKESLLIRTKMRSSSIRRMDHYSSELREIAARSGAEVEDSGDYSPWQPDKGSQLLARSIDCYRSLFGREPLVEIIHAGLECGVIGSKFSGMDMISIGPDIRNAHSPEEKLHVPSVGTVCDFLCALLSTFA